MVWIYLGNKNGREGVVKLKKKEKRNSPQNPIENRKVIG